MNDLHNAQCPCATGWHCCDGECFPNDQRCPCSSGFHNCDGECIPLEETCYADTDDNTGLSLTFEWHSFHGAENLNASYSIALDDQGNSYLAGSANNVWPGPQGHGPRHTPPEAIEPVIFVLKLDPQGSYRWHAFFRELAVDFASLTVDGAGNVYLTGTSISPWLGPEGQSPQTPHSGDQAGNMVVVKLNTEGVYQWHTFYGAERSRSLAWDRRGNLYATGDSTKSWSGPDDTPPLNAHSADQRSNLVILKLTASGTYQWHTFLGDGDHRMHAATIDMEGNIVVTGQTDGPWSGPAGQHPANGYSGKSEIVVLKLNEHGAYQWHTFHGSPYGDDVGLSLAIDQAGGVTIAGRSTNCSWWGPGDQQPLHYAGLLSEGLFVLRLDSLGTYRWHTFYPATGQSLAIGSAGNIFITGYASKTWNGPNGRRPLNPMNEDNFGFYSDDLVILKLQPSGEYAWHTFYGGYGQDRGGEIAIGELNDLRICGTSSLAWNGPNGQAPRYAHSGGDDIFVLKLTE